MCSRVRRVAAVLRLDVARPFHPFRRHESLFPRFVLAFALLACHAAVARADVGPPVKIRFSPEGLRPAVTGEPYQGTIEILIGGQGVLDGFELFGEGWTVREVDDIDGRRVFAGETVRVRFEAVPADISKPLRTSVRFNGRPVRKSFTLSPARFERIGKADPVEQVGGWSGGGQTAGGAVTLRVRGRILYQRQDGLLVGADGIWFEIMDQDPVFDETMFSGYTDPFGFFDVTFNWDDCDITGCDTPDVYIRFETDTPIVQVQRSDILEEDYSWSNVDQVLTDFAGSEIDFGNLIATTNPQAIHIHNSITRAHRFILAHSGINVSIVDVQWPEDGTGAFYNSFWEEIHISAGEEWTEGTIVHEYGHHFLHLHSRTVDPDYCNNTCDTSEDDCGHCLWCQETDHDAWNEGWPNWLGHILNTTYAQDPPEHRIMPLSINDSRYTMESPQTCQVDGMWHDPLLTEGFLGALLVDLTDAAQDDHDGDGTLDCDMDASFVLVSMIFEVVTGAQPITPLEFIAAFRDYFPDEDQDFWSTTRNVAMAYAFPLVPPSIRSQADECQSYRVGDTLEIEVVGNGSLLQYQWRRDSVDLIDGGRISGATGGGPNDPRYVSRLTITSLTAGDSGVYTCLVTTCNNQYSVLSLPIRVSAFPNPQVGFPGLSWGRGDVGQLGQEQLCTLGQCQVPAEIVDLTDMVAISSGSEAWHTLAIKTDRTVVGWGYNSNGQVGTGGVGNVVASPELVPDLSDVVAVSAGGSHSIALKADGTVWTWGYGGYGSLGHGNFNWLLGPVEVQDMSCVVAIQATATASFVLKSDGTVWACGGNYHGIIGRPTGGFYPTFEEIPGATGIVELSCGSYHCLARRANGTVLSWGRNAEGQLGDGTHVDRSFPAAIPGLTNVSSLGTGAFVSFANLTDGTTWGWGTRSLGGLCTGLGSFQSTPALIPELNSIRSIQGGVYHTLIHLADDRVATCGAGGYGESGPRPPATYGLFVIPGLSGVAMIATGNTTSFAVPTGVSPYILEHPLSVTVTAGQGASFSVEAAGAATLSFQWERNLTFLEDGERISGSGAATLSIDPVHLSDAGNYIVFVTNSNGQVFSVPATLTVQRLPSDSTGDGRIDLDDYVDFKDCQSRPGLPPSPTLPGLTRQLCQTVFDRDGDGDVDLVDFARFAAGFTD